MGAILRAADEAEVGQRVRRANYFGVYMRQRRARSSRHMQKLDLQSVMWSIPRDRIKREDTGRDPHVMPMAPCLFSRIKERRHTDGDKAVYC